MVFFSFVCLADTGIASEKDWGINLNKEIKSESGVNEDGSSWYSDSGEDLGENGYRCRWTVMGGRCADGSSEWKEAVCHLDNLHLLWCYCPSLSICFIHSTLLFSLPCWELESLSWRGYLNYVS